MLNDVRENVIQYGYLNIFVCTGMNENKHSSAIHVGVICFKNWLIFFNSIQMGLA